MAKVSSKRLVELKILFLQEEGTSEPAVLSLQAIKGPCEGTTLTKAGKRLTVGRTRVRDIYIKDAAVSEKHAELRWEGNRWTVTDVGSSNGTVLNGRKLSDGVQISHSYPCLKSDPKQR